MNRDDGYSLSHVREIKWRRGHRGPHAETTLLYSGLTCGKLFFEPRTAHGFVWFHGPNRSCSLSLSLSLVFSSPSQARASPTAVGAGVDPGHTHSHRATAAGAHSAPSNPGSDGNRGSSELHPLMRLTIDPKAGPTSGGTGGNKHLHRDHGEESPLPGGGRGGGAEPPLSPGFRVLADTDWDNQSTGSLVPGGTSVSSSPRISGALTPRGGGGGGGVEGVKTAAVVAASKVASLEAVKGMKLLQHFRAHTGAVSCAEFSRKGQYLATGGADGLVKVGLVLVFESSVAVFIPDTPLEYHHHMSRA